MGLPSLFRSGVYTNGLSGSVSLIVGFREFSLSLCRPAMAAAFLLMPLRVDFCIPASTSSLAAIRRTLFRGIDERSACIVLSLGFTASGWPDFLCPMTPVDMFSKIESTVLKP